MIFNTEYGEKIFAVSQILCATNIGREKARKHVVTSKREEKEKLCYLMFRSLFSASLKAFVEESRLANLLIF